jgi:hypothetical protein
MFFGVSDGKGRFARAAEPMHHGDAWRLSDSAISASASSRPRKCNGTLIGMLDNVPGKATVGVCTE